MRRSAISVLVLMLPVMMAGGCSTFDRDWRAMAREPAPEDAITGRWTGRWQSEVNDHSGKLRAIVTEQEGGGYLARYHAVYGGGLTFEHSVDLAVESREADRVEFSGAEDLGLLAGGVYKYDGYATPERFFSSYKSKERRGFYRLQRPPASEADKGESGESEPQDGQ